MLRVVSISIFFIYGSSWFCSLHFFWLDLFPYSLFLIPLTFWPRVFLFLWFLLTCPWLTLVLVQGGSPLQGFCSPHLYWFYGLKLQWSSFTLGCLHACQQEHRAHPFWAWVCFEEKPLTSFPSTVSLERIG